MSYDEVVFRRSYLNLILLNRAIPGIKPYKEEKAEEEGETFAEGKEIHANQFFDSLM